MNDEIAELGVLAVDDSLQMRRLLQGMLSQMGIGQAFVAKDGVEALRFLGECDDMIDVILCDWKMPKMSGIDLLRQVRTVDPDIPFVMVTGLADEASVMAAKGLGVTSYMVKPFSPDQLEKRLNAVARLVAVRKSAA